MTVRQALTHLVNNGYLHRLQGKGTFVAEQKIQQPLQGLTSFTEDMTARGMKPDSQIIQFEMIPSTPQIAKYLSINEYAPVYEIKRVRLADEVPMALETTYISANLVKGLTEEIVNQSLYAYMENKLNLEIDYGSQMIEASIADKLEAQYLNIQAGAPILLIQRNTFLQDGIPAELVKSSYRADRYKFMIQMKREREK